MRLVSFCLAGSPFRGRLRAYLATRWDVSHPIELHAGSLLVYHAESVWPLHLAQPLLQVRQFRLGLRSRLRPPS